MKANNIKKTEQDIQLNFDVRVKQRLENLVDKRVRFCLKNNSYDSLISFEASLLGIYLQKHCIQLGSSEDLDFSYRLENDKGVDIRIPMRQFIRIEEAGPRNPDSIYLVFEQHFWSLEVVP